MTNPEEYIELAAKRTLPPFWVEVLLTAILAWMPIIAVTTELPHGPLWYVSLFALWLQQIASLRHTRYSIAAMGLRKIGLANIDESRRILDEAIVMRKDAEQYLQQAQRIKELAEHPLLN